MSSGHSIFKGLKNLAVEKIVQSAQASLHMLSGSQIKFLIKSSVAAKSKEELESIIGDIVDSVDDDQIKILALRFLENGRLDHSDLIPDKDALKEMV